MVELESEGELTRREVAAFLREFADELDDGTPVESGEGRREEFDSGDRGEFAGDQEGDAGARDARRITLIVGGDSATVTVPDTVEFDVEVESRSPMLRSDVSQGIDFELSWKIEDPDELDDDWIEVE